MPSGSVVGFIHSDLCLSFVSMCSFSLGECFEFYCCCSCKILVKMKD